MLEHDFSAIYLSIYISGHLPNAYTVQGCGQVRALRQAANKNKPDEGAHTVQARVSQAGPQGSPDGPCFCSFPAPRRTGHIFAPGNWEGAKM